MTMTTELLPSASALLSLHAEEVQQKDDFCGAFWGALGLRLAGVDVDQDAVAAAAGSTCTGQPVAEHLPPGATSRRDYRFPPATLEDPVRVGTSATGLGRAIDELGGGEVKTIAVPGQLSEDDLETLISVTASLGPRAVAIANLSTAFLWGGRPDLGTVLGFLEGGRDEGPPADWDVGHFVSVLGQIRGPGGSGVLLADTYRVLGWNGIHFQPAARLLAAVGRPDEPSGGFLLIAPADRAEGAVERLEESGITVAYWDNGSADVLETTSP
jgi:hypothetical protein